MKVSFAILFLSRFLGDTCPRYRGEGKTDLFAEFTGNFYTGVSKCERSFFQGFWFHCILYIGAFQTPYR